MELVVEITKPTNLISSHPLLGTSCLPLQYPVVLYGDC